MIFWVKYRMDKGFEKMKERKIIFGGFMGGGK